MRRFAFRPGIHALAAIVLLPAGPTASAGAADQSLASPATARPVSAGLINDWLLEENPGRSEWDFGGEFRLRYELKENAGSYPNRDFLSGLDNSTDYLLFRTKVHVGWTPADWISVFAEGRDAHSAGDERPVTEDDAFDLHQAWLQLGNKERFPLVATVGRQELSYGDERFVGVSDWSNFGRSFDAGKLRFENDSFWLDAFSGRLVLPRDGHFNQANDYDWFSGIYGSTRQLAPWQATEMYFIARNVSPNSLTAISATLGGPGPRDIYTVGTRWTSVPGRFGNWDYLLEAAGQFGSINQGGTRREHRALAVNATGGYTFKETSGTPRFTIGYDFGSGDTDPTDDRNETFELLPGTNHKLYGLMDVVGLRNMHVPRVGAAVRAAKNLSVSLEWLGFWLADTGDFLFPESGPGRSQNGYARNPGFSSHVGHEIDVQFNWQPAAWGQLQGGYGHFFAGDYIRESAAAGGFDVEDADWVYVQAKLSF